MTPELPEMKGLIYAKNTFSLENFRFEVDISIHNNLRSSMARGDFRIFILRDNPMKSAAEFAHGLDGDYDGIEIHIKEGAERNTDKSKGAPSRVHFMEFRLTDEKRNTIHDTKKTKRYFNAMKGNKQNWHNAF